MVVRYGEADDTDDHDRSEDVPEPTNAQPFWSTIVWFLLALALVALLGLVVKTQGVGW